MPDEPAAADTERERASDTERERAIVEESVAAIEGEPTTAADHPRERRRVRAVIDAIRAAR